MEYKEQLQDPRWQKKRLDIMNRDNFTCVGCGDKDKTLHVHHYTYVKSKKVWDYKNSFLVTLCSKCHELIHEINNNLDCDDVIITAESLKNNTIYDKTYYSLLGNAIKNDIDSLIKSNSCNFYIENKIFVINGSYFCNDMKKLCITNFWDASY